MRQPWALAARVRKAVDGRFDLHRLVAWLLLAAFLGACLPQTGAGPALLSHHAAIEAAAHDAVDHEAADHHGGHDHAGDHATHPAQDKRAATSDHSGHCLLCFVHAAPIAFALGAWAPAAADPLPVVDRTTTPILRPSAWPCFLARAPPMTA